MPTASAKSTAELRDYQEEGFIWLARLARLEAGACLADDMGLGKTVQAIALMLHRAAEGPCLVVAPTSVCPNWAAEALDAAILAETVQAGPAVDGVTRRQALTVDSLEPEFHHARIRAIRGLVAGGRGDRG